MSKTHCILSSKFAVLLVATLFLSALAAPAQAQNQDVCPHDADTLASGNDLYALLMCQVGRSIYDVAVSHFAAGYVRVGADTRAAAGSMRCGAGIAIRAPRALLRQSV